MSDVDTTKEAVERAAAADDRYAAERGVGCHAEHHRRRAATLRALLAERDALQAEVTRLRRSWLATIQTENSCPASGGGCLSKRCGCIEEMEMLMREDDARTLPIPPAPERGA